MRQKIKTYRKALFGQRLSLGLLLGLAMVSSGNVVASEAPPTQNNLSSTTSASQNVTGVITGTQGEPLIGATIRVKESKEACATDLEGRFSLKAAPGNTLEVSYVGMLPAKVKIERGKTDYNISLKESDISLNEVVVVGYGQAKKVNLTGSVSAINVDKISETRPITNVSQALAGLASGVNVNSAGNQPGDDNATIRVRGVGTLNEAYPLVIIDGMEAGINTVNPTDIESMSVLKDAASAAIYGSRAANGVILITTKKGGEGQAKVNYSGYVSFESVRKTITPVSNYADYMELVNEGYFNTYGQENYIFSDESIAEWRENSGKDPLRYPNTNWFDETFKNAVSTNHNLSVSGGTKKTRYFASFGFLYNPGVMPNSAYKRFSARVNVNTDIKPWLTLGVNASGYRSMTEPGAAQQGNLFNSASATSPGVVFQAPDGRFGAANNSEDDPQMRSIIGAAYSRDGDTKRTNVRVQFSGTIRPFKGFSIVGNYNFSLLDSDSRDKPHWLEYWNFKDDVVVSNNIGRSNVSYTNGKTERYFWDAVAHYDATFWDKFQLNAMIGASRELYRTKSFSSKGWDLVDMDLWALDAATSSDAENSGSSSEWAMSSYFGRINLNWDDRYLFEFNLRRDGSSRFRKKNRWGTFPSFSVGWRIDQESFMSSLVDSGLNALKIRASYGELGNNAIGNYDTIALYVTDNKQYSLNNTVIAGLSPAAIANPDLTWESTNVFNIGADVTLFNNRLTASAEYYYKKTKNILIDLPAPYVHGITTLPKTNAAEVSNTGFDLDITWNDNIQDFRYGATFQLGYVKNRVDKFKGKGKDGMSIAGTSVTWEGHQINSQYLLQVDRIIQTDEDLAIVESMIENAPVDANGNKLNPFAAFGTPQKGDFLYKDINGDGIIDANDRDIVSGGAMPNWLLSLNIHAEWRGFDFAMLMQSALGGHRYWNQEGYNTPTVRYGWQISKEAADGRWYEGRTDATYPRLLYNENKINTQTSDFYLYKTDYLKIRNIQLGYTIPRKITSKWGIDKIRVYGSLDNFFTFTNYKGIDLEVTGLGYPTMRQAVIGLNVSF